jgi:transposase
MTNNRTLKKENKRLREELDNLRKDHQQLIEEFANLKKEFEKYKNSNTPSSSNKHLKPNTQGKQSRAGGKRGAPKGHTGTSRPKKKPDVTHQVTAESCPGCESKEIDVVGKQRQQVEELPPDIKLVIVNVERDVCKCRKCKLKFVARDSSTPLQGKFGINLVVLVIFLKFIVRGVLRKTVSFLDASFALKLAPASIQAIISRAAKAAEAEFEALKQKIREAQVVYVDETSFSVLGKNWWVWVFRSGTGLLLVVRNSRGNNVLEEILGKMFTGVVVCDCWRAYDYLSNANIQRCWAHLLRKSKELCESVAGRHFHKRLTVLFDKIKQFNDKEPTEKQREKKYKQMTAKLQKILMHYSQYEECKSVTKYLNFHLENWFTCIKIAGVQPTNNYAEQAIRETVLVRKIIGAFRSVNGTKVYEILASLLATWQLQQKDIRKELHRTLTKNLC